MLKHISKEDIKLAKEFTKKYILPDKPELVIITGSRNFGIRESDFDICIIGKYSKKFIRKYSEFIALEKYPIEYKGIKFEIQLIDWEYIRNAIKEYNNFKAWHLKTSHIIFDKNKKFRKILKRNKVKKEQIKKWVFELYEKAYDNMNNAEKSKIKKYYTTRMLHLYKSLDAILKILYLTESKPVPSLKWRIYFLKNL